MSKVDLSAREGESISLSFTYTSGGQPVDLNDYSALMDVRLASKEALIVRLDSIPTSLELSIVLATPSVGGGTVYVSPAQVSVILAAGAVTEYDLFIIHNSTSDPKYLFGGFINILPAITEP